MDLEWALIIAIIGLILTIIWNTINTIMNFKRNKRLITHVLKIPLKTNLFKKWYKLTVNLTNRMEFQDQDTIKKFHYTEYHFSIKSKDGSHKVSIVRMASIVQRYLKLRKRIYETCEYKKKTY